jgi:glycosyltransferase involved in cell wall biosynthesis
LPPDPSVLSDEGDAQALAEALACAENQPVVRSSAVPASRAAARRAIQSVLLVSHCDFSGNSALHAYRVACGLLERGFSPVLAVPDDPRTVEDVAGRPPFPVVGYDEALAAAATAPPDLVHAFTSRERVRKLVSAVVAHAGCPYVVHLEDNDRAVLSAALEAPIRDLEELPPSMLDTIVGAGQMHPLRGPHFERQAAGVTVVIDALRDLSPPGIETAVVHPGYDAAMLEPSRSRDEVRAELGIEPEEFTVVYTGTIHRANLADMRRLYVALAALRNGGIPVVLVKTGLDAPDVPELARLGEGLRNLGWVSRARLPELVAAADALVQPDAPGPFNDYRFPAKLPDFLASGRPVVLGRTNIGVSLEDGSEALVLERCTSVELYRAIALLRDEPGLARELGEGGRAFALRELRWDASVERVVRLYDAVAEVEPPAPFALELDPPVKVIALVPGTPSTAEAEAARASGIYEISTANDDRPPGIAYSGAYEAELRRRVLAALARAGTEDPVVFVNAEGHLDDDSWLKDTRTAVRDGIRNFYASRGLSVRKRSIDSLLEARGRS